MACKSSGYTSSKDQQSRFAQLAFPETEEETDTIKELRLATQPVEYGVAGVLQKLTK